MRFKDLFPIPTNNSAEARYRKLVSPIEEKDALDVNTVFYASLVTFLSMHGADRIAPLGATPEQLDIIYTLKKNLELEFPDLMVTRQNVNEHNIASFWSRYMMFEDPFMYGYLCVSTVVPRAYPGRGALVKFIDLDDTANKYVIHFTVLSSIPETPDDIFAHAPVLQDPSMKYGVFRKGMLIVRDEAQSNGITARLDFHYIGSFPDVFDQDKHIWISVTQPYFKKKGNIRQAQRASNLQPLISGNPL